MKISAYENQCQGELFRLLGWGITFYMSMDILSIFLGADSPFTLPLSHLLQSSSCFYDSPWEKVIIPPSTLTFWVHIITISSPAWECSIIPAASLYGEESSWNNLSYDDLNCRRCHLLLDIFLENFHVSWCWIIFILIYHRASTCKILTSLLLPFCLHRLWQITLQYETFLMGRKRDPYLENWVHKSKQWENDLSYYCKFHLARCSLILNKMFHHIDTTIILTNISKEAINFSEFLSS